MTVLTKQWVAGDLVQAAGVTGTAAQGDIQSHLEGFPTGTLHPLTLAQNAGTELRPGEPLVCMLGGVLCVVMV